MDRPSIAFAHMMDRAVVEERGEQYADPALVCQDCGALICTVESGDTIRVLVNTALAHGC